MNLQMLTCRRCGHPVAHHRYGQCVEPEDGWHTCGVCGADVWVNEPDLAGVADTCPDTGGCERLDCPSRG